ncbi:MAG: adenosylmethionine--8-amino-7-oxononanoate transaminase [Nitrospirae bacterium]|nr:MAG: adenosylmethionine--8-amino-7-oxononanoate transaminase [Nitrospirota bacterium]
MGRRDLIKRLEEWDKRFIWHPFTQMKEYLESEPVIIEEGKGCFIKDTRGRWYLDGVSSLWLNIYGHRVEKIDRAIKEQLEKIAHSTLLGLGNVPSTELAEKLVSILPGELTKVFYSDNGSTAVEVALKMAFQYWQLKGRGEKKKFISLRNAYHGDTIGAVSVGGIDIFHEIFRPLLFETLHIPSPYCYRCELGLERTACSMDCLKEAERVITGHSDEIAAIIVEPMVQGAGGMVVFPEGYLRGLWEITRKEGILFIADEVATGFGRTGRMFAVEHEGVVPDFICLSKGITGGYLPLAVTVTTEEVFSAFLGRYEEFKTFFHGHSYTGNPLASSAALASLELILENDIPGRAFRRGEELRSWFNEVTRLEHVGDARSLGLMGGVELVADKVNKTPYSPAERVGYRVCMRAREKGLMIRPLGDVIVIMPPPVIERENFQRMLEIIGESIEEVTEG